MELGRIIHHIQQISPASLEDIQRFAGQFQPIILKKGQGIAFDKKYYRSLFFLKKGLLHHYASVPALSSGASKNTIAIYQAGDFFVNPSNNQTSTHHVEAFQDSDLLEIKHEAINSLIVNHPNLLTVYQDLIHHRHRETLAHLQLLQTGTATEKYQAIVQRFGQRLFLIPSQYRAAYIGISRKHLYRLNLSLIKNRSKINLYQKEPL